MPYVLRHALLALMLVVAAVSRCDEPRPAPHKPPPRAGDFVKLRGTLSEDVDCRLLKSDDGPIYSLTARLSAYTNGTKVCIHGTILETTQCLIQPTIEVQSVRAWSACP